MGTVKTTFVSDDKSALAALKRLQKENDVLKQKTADVGKVSTQATNQAIKGWGGVRFASERATNVSRVALDLLAHLTDATREWNEQTAAAAAAQRDLGAAVASTLQRSGQSGITAQVRQSLAGMQGVSFEQAQGLFAAASESGPLVDPQRRLQITETASRAVAGLGATGAGQVARDLGSLTQLLGDRSTDDLADVSTVLRQRLGDDLSRLGERPNQEQMALLQGRGYSQDEALAALALAQERGLAPEEGVRIDRESVNQLAAALRAAQTGNSYAAGISAAEAANPGARAFQASHVRASRLQEGSADSAGNLLRLARQENETRLGTQYEAGEIWLPNLLLQRAAFEASATGSQLAGASQETVASMALEGSIQAANGVRNVQRGQSVLSGGLSGARMGVTDPTVAANQRVLQEYLAAQEQIVVEVRRLNETTARSTRTPPIQTSTEGGH